MNLISATFLVVILAGPLQAQTQKGNPKPASESPSKGVPTKSTAEPRPKSPISTEEIRAAIAKDADATRLFQSIVSGEALYSQGATDGSRAELIKAHLDFAEYVMLKPLFETTIPEPQKYLIAYKSYLRVLELDPKEKSSRGRIQTIVNIYQSWGKTLP